MGASQTLTYPIVQAGADWLTMTCNEPELRRAFQDWSAGILHIEHDAGDEIAPWRFLQFEGLHCGGVGFGQSLEMDCLRLSSDCARAHAAEALRFATGVSRLDLQVTIGSVASPAELVMDHHNEARVHFADWACPPEVALRSSNVRSPTVYFNRRTSLRFGRIYDKGNEDQRKEYQGCVRYEVQLNKRAAKLAASAWSKSESKELHAIGTVSGFFSKVGVNPRFAAEETTFITVPRSRTDDGRRLTWLGRQVRPCIEALIDRGLGKEVLEVLGLDGCVSID